MAADVRTTVVESIQAMMSRRGVENLEFDLDADIFDDLEMDSLEVAELSATLEDEYGTDPYTAGESPRRPSEIIGFLEERAR